MVKSQTVPETKCSTARFHVRQVLKVKKLVTPRKANKKKEPLTKRSNGVAIPPSSNHSFHTRDVIRTSELYEEAAVARASMRAQVYSKENAQKQINEQRFESNHRWYKCVIATTGAKRTLEKQQVENRTPQEVAIYRVKKRKAEIEKSKLEELEKLRMNRWYLKDPTNALESVEVGLKRANKNAKRVLRQQQEQKEIEQQLAQEQKEILQHRLSLVQEAASRALPVTQYPKHKKLKGKSFQLQPTTEQGKMLIENGESKTPQENTSGSPNTKRSSGCITTDEVPRDERSENHVKL